MTAARSQLVDVNATGSYFSADRERLRQLARQRGVHHLDNLATGPA